MATNEISSLLQEDRSFPPPAQFSARSHIKDSATYDELYRRSIEDPAAFWAEQATENLVWFKPWQETLREDLASIGNARSPYVSYFVGGELNASYNCLDRHLDGPRRNKAAIQWQGEAEDERRCLTYQQLHRAVCRFANVLKKHGVKRGDPVTIFMPMVPELPIAMLACARIGAIHSVVFSAFSADSLRNRINDCASKMVITADVGFHAGKVSELKYKVDDALSECPSVVKVIVYRRGKGETSMEAGRDSWWHEEVDAPDIEDTCPAESMGAEDPLYILYTSGSTGKPKGVLHTTGGYLLHVHLTTKWYFDLRDEDLFWCTADIGWVTGHSYVVYGPLSNGASVMMFEGVPTYPQPDRFWKVIADYRVSVFYTAPTAIRALMRLGNSWPEKHNLSSLRLLGSVGEPINPEAWVWYHQVIGKGRCPLIDTWWQTETGGIMISTLPGAIAAKPGSAGKPFFGVAAQVLKEDGTPARVNEGGSLVITKSWPGMIRGVYGDQQHELIKQVYFSKYPGRYFTSDGCRIDGDGYYWLLGRIDDVLNVSGHRLATAEIESALVSHHTVAEAAVVGCPHETKGQGIYCFVTLKEGFDASDEMRATLIAQVRREISPIATPDVIHFAEALPKTRSGKIMRRILRKIAEGKTDLMEIGDTSTLADPGVVKQLIDPILR